jgi:NAD(P)-dependent dehydrogenase (short-subunit alcohol dehydrogenase family)
MVGPATVPAVPAADTTGASPVPSPAALFDLTERVAVVTGASSGLGDRFARVLHAAGATVVAAARRTDRLEALADELGERIVVVPADLTDAGARERLVATAVERRGRLDLVVNNAGLGTPAPSEDETLERFEATMDLNVTAVFHLCQLAARSMLASSPGPRGGRGSIVNIASVLGLVASAPIKEAAYCASKGAVVNLTRQLGAEWGRKGVRVNAIAPGWFPTEMTQTEMFDDEGGRAFIERNTPMGRAGYLDELDGALLFLAGDASTYVTGHVLTVDGGWVAR